MKNFTIGDLSGAGQYLIRMCPQQIHRREKEGKPYVVDTGFLSTIMYKVGWITNNFNIKNDNIEENNNQVSALISMSDGMIRICHYHSELENIEEKKKRRGKPIKDFSKTVWTANDDDDISGKQKLVDYLNHPNIAEYRFATQEEVARVVMYQKHRWR